MAVWSEISLSDTRRSFGRLDSEFYQPVYLANEEALSHLPTVQLRQIRSRLDVGHVGPMVSHYAKDGVLFLQTQNVKPFFLDLTHSVRIDRDFHNALPKSMIRKGDVLLARSGSFGTASIYLDDDVVNAADIIIVSVAAKVGVDPRFLVAFMNSRFGVNQLLRFASGGLQGHVNLHILENFIVPRIEDNEQKRIAKQILSAYKARVKSETAFSTAKQLLSEALSLDALRFERPLSYTANFSDVMAQGRADADYFQIPYVQVHSHLDRFEWRPLSQLVDFVKGVEVGSNAYENSGKLFLRVSNVTERGLKYNTSDKYIGRKLYDQLRDAFEPQVGELLLTKDGTPGVCWVVDQPVEGIVSGALVRLVPKQKGVPQEYLALAINSILCRMQVEQNASGALILHWKLPLIKKLRVPLCDQDVMKRIATLVKESKKQHYKSVALLEEAKARVEQLIEEAANRA